MAIRPSRRERDPGTVERPKLGEPSSNSRPENRPPQLAQNTNPNALQSADSQRQRRAHRSAEHRRGPTTVPAGCPERECRADKKSRIFRPKNRRFFPDTKGYDFGPYMNQVVNRVRYNWYSLIPESARLGKKGRVVITLHDHAKWFRSGCTTEGKLRRGASGSSSTRRNYGIQSLCTTAARFRWRSSRSSVHVFV